MILKTSKDTDESVIKIIKMFLDTMETNVTLSTKSRKKQENICFKSKIGHF